MFVHSTFYWEDLQCIQMWRFILKFEKEMFRILYKTSHEKFMMGLQNNLKPAAVTMTL